jgi:hypothetical protein
MALKSVFVTIDFYKLTDTGLSTKTAFIETNQGMTIRDVVKCFKDQTGHEMSAGECIKINPVF